MLCRRIVTLAVVVIAFRLGEVIATADPSPASAKPAVSATTLIPPLGARARRYINTRYAIYFVQAAWSFLGLGLLVKLRLGSGLRTRIEKRIRPLFIRVPIFYAGFNLTYTLWLFPVALASFIVEKQYGFARNGPALWLQDQLTSYMVDTALFTPIVWLGIVLVKRSPKKWWLWLWLATIPLALVGTVLYPVVVDPLFNDFKPMPDTPLRARLLALADKAGIRGARVLVADKSRRTTRVNAYVTGLGPTSRIVIWDTTLKALDDDEIVAIAGHEMGHYVMGHIWQGFWMAVAGSLIILFLLSKMYAAIITRMGGKLGIDAPHDLAGIPLFMLLLSLLLFLQTPIESAISRHQEHKADMYGLELTGLKEATARAFASFVTRDYSDPDPPAFIVFWFYSHPPARSRIECALNFKPANNRRN